MRVVYDASAKSSKELGSLNEALHTGPSLLPEIIAALMKFRLFPIGLVADIEKAFLQVLLSREDRDATRFMWLKDIEGEDVDENILHLRFRRVLFGASPSLFLMIAAIKHHLNSYGEDWVAKDIQESLYSDNLVSGEEDEDTALEYYDHSREIFLKADMNLRKWVTNSEALQGRFEETDIAESKLDGILWNTRHDSFQIPVDKMVLEMKNLQRWTQRIVCSTAAKIYDTLGFIEPFTVTAKILLQELWISKVGWDDEIPSNLKKMWQKWMQEVQQIADYRIKRRYFQCRIAEVSETEIHCFTDSSEKSYGSVAYLRIKTPNGTEVQHIISKSHIAPIKKQTTPRMELMAAVLGSEMIRKVLQVISQRMKIANVIFWCDSQIVLYWIYKGSSDGFVQRIVDIIREITEDYCWKYCPTKMNTADVVSRGSTIREVIDSRWADGPRWLQNREEWPSGIFDASTQPTYEAAENENKIVNDRLKIAMYRIPVGEKKDIRRIIKIEDHSTLNKLLMITAMVYRFITNCYCRPSERKLMAINSDDNYVALEKWIRVVQKEYFRGEIESIKRNDGKSSLVRQLRLYSDDEEILRCRGRLEHTLLPDEVKFPILLPRGSWLTRLLILYAHEAVFHGRVRDTLTEIRQNFWILQGRKAVRSAIRRCVPCLKVDGSPFKGSEPPSLPTSRVTEGLPSQFTGVDLAGPMFVKTQNKQALIMKVYICLYTCAVLRAVHLDVVEDMSVAAFLRSFRRFISRRGIPEEVISDNAMNFKDAAQELSSHASVIMESGEAQKYLFNKGIKWHFIMEGAPWWGGFYERMVGTVKNCLKKAIGKSLLTFEEFRTIIPEVEAVVNSRPLTYLYSDVEDGVRYHLRISCVERG